MKLTRPLAVAVPALLALLTTGAQAHSNVQWSISIGMPFPAPLPVVVAPPPPVYVAPYPVYGPPPVVYAPAPVVYRPHRHAHRDSDRDGVPDRWDRRPYDPWR